MISPRLPDSVAHWPLDRLRAYVRNPRMHSDEQIAQIAASSGTVLPDAPRKL